MVILGGSGSGKTTILRLILGLYRPDQGSIHLAGQDITVLPERDLFEIRQHMAMVFQGSALFDSLTVRENVGYRLWEHGRLSDERIEQTVRESLLFVGLEDTIDKMPAELSGGMRKRVGIARALASGAVAMIMNLEEGMGLLARQTKFRAVVPHTQGLKVGGPVRLNGVDIGNVHHIAIAENSPLVDITFAVKNSVVPHIREDATVSIRPMGLLGDKFLEIHPGTPSKPETAPGGQLVGEAEADLTGIASNATATMEHVNTAIRETQRILISISQGQGTASKLLSDPSVYDHSKRVIENLERASEKSLALLDKVERGEGTIGRLVSDKEIYNRANHAVRELTDLAARLNNQNGTLAKLADPVLYKRLDTLTTRGEQLLNKVESGEGTIGKLVTQDELYTRADKLLTEVEELVADVKKHPTKYFKFSVF